MKPSGNGKDWNSFRTVGDETGYRKQPVTWVHYAGMLVFCPVAAMFGIPLAIRLAMGRFGMIGIPGSSLLMRGTIDPGQWIPLAILGTLGFGAGAWICVHMYRGEQKEKRIRELQDRIAAENAAASDAPDQDSQAQASRVMTGSSDGSPDAIERMVAASRRRS